LGHGAHYCCVRCKPYHQDQPVTTKVQVLCTLKVSSSNIVDRIVNLNLYTLSLFLHSTLNCLINQPEANYHRLLIKNLQHENFQHAMKINTTNITEEIYVTLYEVRSNDKDQNPDDFPKIYTSYCTEKNTYKLKEIPGVHASNPTRSGLQLLVAALKLPQEKLEYYANIKDQETKLVQVIDEIANIQKI